MAVRKVAEFVHFDNHIEMKVVEYKYHNSLYFYVNGKRTRRSAVENLLDEEGVNTREQDFFGMVCALKSYNAPKLVMEALLVELDKYMTENTVDENIIERIMEKVND